MTKNLLDISLIQAKLIIEVYQYMIENRGKIKTIVILGSSKNYVGLLKSIKK